MARSSASQAARARRMLRPTAACAPRRPTCPRTGSASSFTSRICCAPLARRQRDLALDLAAVGGDEVAEVLQRGVVDVGRVVPRERDRLRDRHAALQREVAAHLPVAEVRERDDRARPDTQHLAQARAPGCERPAASARAPPRQTRRPGSRTAPRRGRTAPRTGRARWRRRSPRERARCRARRSPARRGGAR